MGLIRKLRELWLGYDPTTTFTCDKCGRTRPGSRYTVPGPLKLADGRTKRAARRRPRSWDALAQRRLRSGVPVDATASTGWAVVCEECAKDHRWAGTGGDAHFMP